MEELVLFWARTVPAAHGSRTSDHLRRLFIVDVKQRFREPGDRRDAVYDLNNIIQPVNALPVSRDMIPTRQDIDGLSRRLRKRRSDILCSRCRAHGISRSPSHDFGTLRPPARKIRRALTESASIGRRSLPRPGLFRVVYGREPLESVIDSLAYCRRVLPHACAASDVDSTHAGPRALEVAAVTQQGITL